MNNKHFICVVNKKRVHKLERDLLYVLFFTKINKSLKNLLLAIKEVLGDAATDVDSQVN
ncbi:hypothetical protein Q5M85_11020 [Paraclostridium bifermentans]|nr:hypothetical protein [Paraclostridium bifermentans]